MFFCVNLTSDFAEVGQYVAHASMTANVTYSLVSADIVSLLCVTYIIFHIFYFIYSEYDDDDYDDDDDTMMIYTEHIVLQMTMRSDNELRRSNINFYSSVSVYTAVSLYICLPWNGDNNDATNILFFLWIIVTVS